MHDSIATPSHAANTPARVHWLAIAGLLLLSSACSGDSPVSPTAVHVPVASATARATGDPGPAACVPDSKLIGRIALSTADEPGTWWHLTREGLDAAGMTDYLAAIEGFFGREFASTEEAIGFLVAQVGPADANGNGFVCAYSIRGTRTSIGDPNFAFYLFVVRDDKHAER